ncbi:HEAT repeat domain-containing protein [Chloroflexota bacterium]
MNEFDESIPAEIPFQDVLDALLDTETLLPPRYLYRFSDLESDNLAALNTIWGQVPTWRRKALLEDLEQLFGDDYLLSFEAICRLGMEDPEAEIRFLSIRALFEYETEDLIPVFLDLTVNDKEEDVRAVAATVLGKYVYQGEVEEIPQKTLRQIEDQLLAVTHGTDTMLVRRRALEALGFSSRDELPALIETAFNHAEYDWVVSAIFAMGRSCDKRWQEPVLKTLDHVLPAVRTEAARAAGEIEISDALERLIELLDDDNEEVRLASAWSLSQIGGEGVQEALDMMLHETEDTEQANFIESAIDNLIFNQGVQFYGILDYPQGEDDLDGIPEAGFNNDGEEEAYDYTADYNDEDYPD